MFRQSLDRFLYPLFCWSVKSANIFCGFLAIFDFQTPYFSLLTCGLLSLFPLDNYNYPLYQYIYQYISNKIFNFITVGNLKILHADEYKTQSKKYDSLFYKMNFVFFIMFEYGAVTLIYTFLCMGLIPFLHVLYLFLL